MQKYNHDASVIALALDKLVSSRIDGSFLNVTIDKAYAQGLFCEAISNRFLFVDRKLESEPITALMLLGFEETSESPNYCRVLKVHDRGTLTDIAIMILEMFTTNYLCSPDSEADIDLHIE